MARRDFDNLPTYMELPMNPGLSARSAWGIFGDNDELGCLNFLTPEGVVEAARLVRKGTVIRLDMPVGYAQPPLFNRPPARQDVLVVRPNRVFDDLLSDYDTQEGSQWDGLRHYVDPESGSLYNGVPPDEVTPGPDGRLGIHHWRDRMVGRGVLLDVFGYRASAGRPVDPGSPEVYTVGDFEGAAQAQQVEVKAGDFLLVRTGWMQHYRSLDVSDRQAYGTLDGLRSCGVDPSSSMVGWLWDHRVAAIACDNPSVEPYPPDPERGHLHPQALPLLGLPLGEQWDLDELATHCAGDGVYEFMLVSVPLHLVGGIASPPNAVAIK